MDVLFLTIAKLLTDKKLCVNIRVVSGPHLGQRFRLEPTAESKDDVFKIGRSTGKLFKEKGVSLYKDKETSTTHAKVGGSFDDSVYTVVSYFCVCRSS